ncbi:MAG TPA: SBBP repeat-containing protein [Terriglobia bacterium]|nr:SBBP repeat-containing protein [Terriglobia bacterium]
MPSRDARVTSSARALVQYARLPMRFERNQGQTDRRVKFLARGEGYGLFLTADEAVLALQHNSGLVGQPISTVQKPAVLHVKLAGAQQGTRVLGVEELPGKSNYFMGNDPRGWHTGIPTYARVRYSQVYRGVDLVYYGRQDTIESDFEISPGSDADQIQMRIDGAQKLNVDTQGDLVLQVSGGEVRFRRPVAYQESAGRRREVAAHYRLNGKQEVKFELAEYDHQKNLIIDPVLTYATYLGGSGGEVANGIAVDSAGNAYVTGITGSTDFPITQAEQPTNAGNGDAFVAKLNAAGTGLIYSTYLGGSGVDTATSIAIDAGGNAYIAGNTTSRSFPTTAGAFQTSYGGGGDGFISKISATGSTLVYSSYIGGTGSDSLRAIALDSSGSAYLTGSTESVDFPTVNPLQIGNDGASDAFVAKVSPSGGSLLYSTYLGGSSADFGQAIAVDGSGNAYVGGYTYSSNFPTQNAFQSSSGGGVDAFVSVLNATGTAFIYSTYVGGSGQDRAFGLALDSGANVYLTGDTQSADFPTTSNAFQLDNHGGGDVFVCRISAGGSGLIFSTLLGGTGADQGTAIAVDSSGNAYVTGFTQSGDFPTVDPLQRILGISGASSCGTGSCADAFVAELRSSGQLVYSTYIGGNGADSGQAIAVDSSGRAYVAGSTASVNFPIIDPALQGAYAGNGTSGNAFIAKIDSADLPGLSLNPQQVNFGNQGLNSTSNPISVSLVNAGSATLTITNITASGDFSQTNNCGSTVTAAGGSCTIQVSFTPTTTGTRTDEITVTDNAAGSPHQITVTGTGVASSAGSLTFTPSSLSFPAEVVGNTSPSQVVRLTNTGSASLTLSAISITGDFAQTNTCGGLPTSLNVGDACTVSITFTPTGSGQRTGTLTVANNAASGPQTVALTGTGNAVFSLSSNSRSSVIQIGTKSTTFTVNVSAPSSFVDSVTLGCSSGATCSFNPPSITAGQSSTVTVTGLTANTANPFNFNVVGTDGSQNASVALTLFLSDFSISATPALNTISAGASASYTVTVTPSNGFNGVVLLGCNNVPPQSTCAWSPSAVSLNGVPVTAKLTINTTAQTGATLHHPSGPISRLLSRFGISWWMVCLAIFILSAMMLRDWRRRGERIPARLLMGLRLAALCVTLVIVAPWMGCNNYYQSGFSLTSTGKGTTSGVYRIAITGTLGNDNTVTRSTTVNLAVGM